MFKIGDVVRFAPEWCEEEERHYLLVIREMYPDRDHGQAYVQYLNGTFTFLGEQLVELVDFEMLQPVGINVEEYMSGKGA